MNMKDFRWKDSSFLNLFADQLEWKLQVIEPILKDFPQRKFILVGDSGEKDPEVYAALARKYPDQIIFIFIRDVTDESAQSERYKKAFKEIPQAKWKIFKKPDELLPINIPSIAPVPTTTKPAE